MMVTAHHVDDVYTPALAVIMAMVRDGGSGSKFLMLLSIVHWSSLDSTDEAICMSSRKY